MDDADYFKSLASAKKAEEKREQDERQKDYDFTPILWSSFQNSGESKLVRFRDPILIEKRADLKITGPSGKPLFDQYSGRVVEMAWLYGDNGKRKLFFVPSKEDDPGHIFWKLRELILKKEWVVDPDSTEGKKKPLYVHQHTHPELVDRFLTNGYNHSISKNKFDRGWKVQQILMANIVDYEMVDIHSERKSWSLLSKNVNIVRATEEGKSDVYYYDWGVPSYGFINQLRDTISHYGALNTYDMSIERTGMKDTPWKIRNASIYKAEVADHLQKLISDKETLTEEQLSWELYDIADLTKPSSNLKWFKTMKSLFMEIDLKFKTNFHDEMEAKAEVEQKELDRLEAEKPKEDTPIKVDSPTVEENSVKTDSSPVVEEKKPTRSRSRSEAPSTNGEPITWETLNKFGYKLEKEKLTDTIKNLISHITSDGRVVWKEGIGELIPDSSDCGFEAISGVKDSGFETPDNPDIDFCLYCGRGW